MHLAKALTSQSITGNSDIILREQSPHGLVPFKDYYISTPTPEVKLPRNFGRHVQTYQLESQGQVKEINLIGDKIEMLSSFGRS